MAVNNAVVRYGLEQSLFLSQGIPFLDCDGAESGAYWSTLPANPLDKSI